MTEMKNLCKIFSSTFLLHHEFHINHHFTNNMQRIQRFIETTLFYQRLMISKELYRHDCHKNVCTIENTTVT